MILSIGAILGFISVAFGAYAEHGLTIPVSTEHLQSLITALRYSQDYSILISALGVATLASKHISDSYIFKASCILFIIGTVLFSFATCLSITLDIPALLKLAPIGRLALILGWIALVVSGISIKKNSSI